MCKYINIINKIYTEHIVWSRVVGMCCASVGTAAAAACCCCAWKSIWIAYLLVYYTYICMRWCTVRNAHGTHVYR